MKLKIKTKFLSVLLALALVTGLVPGMSLTAQAEATTYTDLIPVTPKIGNTTTGEVTNGNTISLTKYTGDTFPVSENYYLDGDLNVNMLLTMVKR